MTMPAPRRAHRVSLLAVLVALAALLTGPAPSRAQDYEVVDLGAGVYPNDMNEDGVVVGGLGAPGEHKTFLWRDGVMTIITPADWEAGSARQIASDGTVVGQAVLHDPVFPTRPYIYRDGAFTFIDAGASIGAAMAINDSGMIGGFLQDRTGFGWSQTYPFLVAGGVVTRPSVFGEGGGVSAINEAGVAVGNSGGNAVRWENFEASILPPLAAGYSWATDINESGVIVGASTSTELSPWGAPEMQPVMWVNGSLVDLATIDGNIGGQAMSINDAGDIVGHLDFATRPKAFLVRAGSIRLLDDIAGPSSGWAFWMASNIANDGTIVGAGIPPGAGPYEVHGFVLKPATTTPEQMIDRLATTVAGYGLHQGTAQSLLAKLASARGSLGLPAACKVLGALANEIAALAGSKLTAAQAEELTTLVAKLAAKLDC